MLPESSPGRYFTSNNYWLGFLTVRLRNHRAKMIHGALRDDLRNAKTACAKGGARSVLIIVFGTFARILHILGHLKGFGDQNFARDRCKRIRKQYRRRCRQGRLSAHFEWFYLQLREADYIRFALRESPARCGLLIRKFRVRDDFGVVR